MSHDHDHHDSVRAPEDAGSQALAEALRSSFAIVKVAMVLMVLAFFGSGFFTVGPAEKGIILRFGKPVGEAQNQELLGAGLHWSFPYPIDEVVKIPITEQQIIHSSVGWYATTPEQELSGAEMPAGPSLNPAVDGYAITADRNIIHTRATLRYHIERPVHYVFDFVSASNTVQNALNNALLYTAAHYAVDDILTRDVAGFQEAVLQRVGDLTEQYRLGIVIDQCEVQSIAPRQLKGIFSEVTTARENRNKLINEARSYENKVLNRSSGQAFAITSEAATASGNSVKSINAEAKRFGDLLPKYQSNPGLFMQVAFLQTVSQIMTNSEKWIQPTADTGKSTQVRLMLNREPPQPKAAPKTED